jgi:hypothetical protein
MERFNFEKAVKDILAGKKISGKDVVLAPLIKEFETVPKCQDQFILKFNILHNLSNFFAIFISFSV